jgi:hypothetical protein
MNNKINPWDLDIRVRDRNLKSGMLSAKDIEKVTSALVDVADHIEVSTLPQPAIAGRDDSNDD